MTEWKEYKLGEIVHIIGGGTPKTSEPKYWNGSIPWLSVVDFNNGNKYVYDAEKYITQEGLENSSTRLFISADEGRKRYVPPFATVCVFITVFASSVFAV